jgi:drug/metabolite transporter (DMT)-like permease
MRVLELSAGLALLASLFSALQAVAVEHGLSTGEFAPDRSPALTAAVISIVVSVVVFWTLLVARGFPVTGATLAQLVPFAVAGLANPAAFRLLYFSSIDRIGARLSAAVVSANPAVAAVLAVPVLGERFTLLPAAGLLCIVAGAVVLQAARAGEDDSDDLLVEELAVLDARDLAVPLAAMCLLAGSFVLVKVGLEGYGNTLVGTAVGQTAALVGFVVLFGASGSARRRASVRDPTAILAFTLAGVFVAANWLAWFSALRLGTVVTVVPLANVYPLFIVALSYALVRRVPKSPRVIAGIGTIVVGATLMQLG